LDFREQNDRSPLGVRAEAALRSAAYWLQLAVFLQAVSGLFCCCFPVLERANAAVVILPVSLVTKYLPLLCAGLAASSLSARRSYGLCWTGAVLIMLASLVSFFEVIVATIFGFSELGPRAAPASVFALLLAVVGLIGCVGGFVAGVKVMSVLSSDSIRRTFR
jgi:hypothetical protein